MNNDGVFDANHCRIRIGDMVAFNKQEYDLEDWVVGEVINLITQHKIRVFVRDVTQTSFDTSYEVRAGAAIVVRKKEDRECKDG